MKKKITGLLLAILMVVGFMPVYAVQDYDLFYDETDLIDSDYAYTLANTTLTSQSEEYRTEIRIDVITRNDGYSAQEYGDYFYEKYAYGYDGTLDGISLTVNVSTDDGSLALQDYAITVGGANQISLETLKDSAMASLQENITADQFAGSIEEDQVAFEQMVSVFLSEIDTYFDSEPSFTPGVVIDRADILSAYEEELLMDRMEALADQYSVGVYFVTIENYLTYGTSVESASESIYEQYDMGLSNNKDGILLLLSMEDRDFDICVHGSGEELFQVYARDTLVDAFRPDFRNDNWYDGLSAYLDQVETILVYDTTSGQMFTMTHNPEVDTHVPAMSFLLGSIISLIVVFSMRRKMKSVRQATQANQYVKNHGMHFTQREDRFIRTKRTERRIEKDSGGSSSTSSSSGGGYSHTSGKF